jgi:ribonuclease J
VDGLSVGDVGDAQLKDRRILGDEGFVSVFVVVDSASGKVVAGPEIHARGFAEDDAVFDEVRALIEAALADAAREGVSDLYQLRQVVRRTVGRWVNDRFRRRPMIVPIVVEI